MQNPTKKKMIRAFNSNETKKVKWSSSYHANERRRWRRVAQNTFNNKLHKENKNKVNTQTLRKGKSSCKRISNIIGKNLNKKKIKCNVCKYRCVCVCVRMCVARVCAPACVREDGKLIEIWISGLFTLVLPIALPLRLFDCLSAVVVAPHCCCCCCCRASSGCLAFLSVRRIRVFNLRTVSIFIVVGVLPL